MCDRLHGVEQLGVGLPQLARHPGIAAAPQYGGLLRCAKVGEVYRVAQQNTIDFGAQAVAGGIREQARGALHDRDVGGAQRAPRGWRQRTVHGVVDDGRVAVEQCPQIVEHRQPARQQRTPPLQGVDELEAESFFHRRRHDQVGRRQQVIEAQPMRVQPFADAAQAGDVALGKQPLDFLRVGGFGRGGGGQGNDQVGSGEPRQQARLQHVLAAPYAHRVQPQGTARIVIAAAHRLVRGRRGCQPDARRPRRFRIGRRNRRRRAHRVGKQGDAIGGTAGGNQGAVVAAVQHRVADVGAAGVGRSGYLPHQAGQIRRPRVLREIVNLQDHRLPGGGGEQHRSGKAGVLGQVMVVDPPHSVAEPAPEQIGELALAGGGGGRVIVAHGVEAPAFDRRAKPAVFGAGGDHDQPVQLRNQVRVGEQGARAVADHGGDAAGQQVVVEQV